MEASLGQRQALVDLEGAHDRGGGHGRSECLHPDASAGALPADVWRPRRCFAPELRDPISQSALDLGGPQRLGLQRHAVAVHTIRRLGKADLVHNGAMPALTVKPLTCEVCGVGVLLTCEPVIELPLAKSCFLF